MMGIYASFIAVTNSPVVYQNVIVPLTKIWACDVMFLSGLYLYFL